MFGGICIQLNFIVNSATRLHMYYILFSPVTNLFTAFTPQKWKTICVQYTCTCSCFTTVNAEIFVGD